MASKKIPSYLTGGKMGGTTTQTKTVKPKGRSAAQAQVRKSGEARSMMVGRRAQARANQGKIVESPKKPTNRPVSSSVAANNPSSNPTKKVITQGLIKQNDTMWVLPQKKNGKVTKGGYLGYRKDDPSRLTGKKRGDKVTGKVLVSTPGSTYSSRSQSKRTGQTGSGTAQVIETATYKYGRNVNSPAEKGLSTGRHRSQETTRAKNKANAGKPRVSKVTRGQAARLGASRKNMR